MPDKNFECGADLLRLLDANANRIREGIRTAEDYARFCAGENRWARRLKAIRNDLTALLERHVGLERLVQNRNALGDPIRPQNGEAVVPGASGSHESTRSVAQRGLKRAQEALRVLEENLRGAAPQASAELSRWRYELYDCEQWTVCCSETASVLSSAQLYVLITESLSKNGLLETTKSVLRGGAKLLQIREKEKSDRDYVKQAREMLRLCKDWNAVLFCNDRVDATLTVGAPGVHLGQDDLSPAEVRKCVGEKIAIGRSTHTVEQAQEAVGLHQVDYIGIGSMFPTTTKSKPILAGLQLAERVGELNLPVPVFAIGGIQLDKLHDLKATGIRRVAVSTAIIGEGDPESATKRFLEALLR